MTDVVVTTPRFQRENAAREAAECIADGGGYYFRKVPFVPNGCDVGSKCFYVEDGYVRGFAVIDRVVRNGHFICETTGHDWGHGNFLRMPSDTWHWIRPIPMQGFMGIRIFTTPFEVMGGWLDPRPSIILHGYTRCL